MFEILAGQVGKLSANVIYQIWVMIQLVFFTLVESLIIKTLLLDYNVDFILIFTILTISSLSFAIGIQEKEFSNLSYFNWSCY